MMLLELEGIGKRFGHRTVLHGINLALQGGEVILLTGANGTGKTTLMRIMAGLIRQTQGVIKSSGIKAGEVGYLGHSPSVYPGLSALDNLAFWQRVNEKPYTADVLNATLKRVELERHGFERAAGFSRGMLQRLNIARLLLQEPLLLLLDEPGTGLDVASTAILRREITTAKDRGAAVVWISHSVRDDLPFAGRVIVLKQQQIDFDGPASNYVFENPASGTKPC
jgi:heme exporter protein A